MRTLLLTGYDEKMEPIGELTRPLMQKYAMRHGLDFFRFLLVTPGQPAYWEKVPQILAAFKTDLYARVIWLDADQMITNPDATPWKTMTSGFQASRDWGADAVDDSHFSACGFVVCRDALPMFEWLEEHKADWIDKPFPEQAPMRYIYRERLLGPFKMTIHPRRVFNAVPGEIDPTVQEPWEPGDWCAHLTNVPVERRVELFHDIKHRHLSC